MTAPAAIPPLARSIGVTERALRSLLEIRLRETRLSFAQWAVLNFLQAATTLTVDQLVQQQIDAVAVSTPEEARTAIDDLRNRGLTTHTPESSVALSEAGRAFFQPLLEQSQAITQELWGDLPMSDLEATHRTLTEIGRRTNVRLAELTP
jgi:hypothetical protein